MRHYVVGVREVWIRYVAVSAKNKNNAVDRVADGDGEDIESVRLYAYDKKMFTVVPGKKSLTNTLKGDDASAEGSG